MFVNPFNPTFGAVPTYWAGRRELLDNFVKALEPGASYRHRMLLIGGVRGIGKTALLNEFEDRARQQGWIVLPTSARVDFVSRLVESDIPEQLQQLSGEKKRVLSSIGVAGVGQISTESNDQGHPVATLLTRLHELYEYLNQTGVLITVDEIQDAPTDELVELAVTIQHLIREGREIALIVTGLQHQLGRLTDLPGATFLRRAEQAIIGPLTDADSQAVFLGTVEDSTVQWSSSAVDKAVALAQGYPYLVQLVGFEAWDAADSHNRSEIISEDIEEIAHRVIEDMGEKVHSPTLKDLTAAERDFVTAMAGLSDAAEVDIAGLADALGKPQKALSRVRQQLIDAGVIAPVGWGKLTFTMPYFAEYLRSVPRIRYVQ